MDTKQKNPNLKVLHEVETATKEEYLTAEEVAQDYFCGKICYKTVLRMTREGGLPGVKMGKHYLYQRTALDRWTSCNFSTPPQARLRSIKY